MKLILTKALTQISDLDLLAVEVNSLLIPGSTILLSGDLGSGKTSFVSAFCKIHKISTVQSPTYAIHNRYKTPDGQEIDHFDLYRLESEDQINASGFYDLLAQSSMYKFIEWPERLTDLNFLGPVFQLKFSLNNQDRKVDLFKI